MPLKDVKHYEVNFMNVKGNDWPKETGIVEFKFEGAQEILKYFCQERKYSLLKAYTSYFFKTENYNHC